MKRSIFCVLVCLSCVASGAVRSEILVTNHAEWRYLHPTDGVDPAKNKEDFHDAFMKPEFDDSKWKKGKDKPGPHHGFGYGDEGFKGVDLIQPADSSHRKSAYFRIKFKLDRQHEYFVFKCQRDDGIIVYLDGEEVIRDNVPRDAKDKYDLFALATISGADETRLNQFVVKKKMAPGEHTLAISLHNRANGSSDLRIAEISLAAIDEADAQKIKKGELEEAEDDDLF